jgi:hypothetical protein
MEDQRTDPATGGARFRNSPIARGAISIAFMAVACAACGAMFALEVIPASLLAVLVMSPATILFLLVEKYEGPKGGFRHTIYLVYFAPWMLFFFYGYLNAVEGREITLLAMFFTTVAAISGYAPLLGTRRFGVRTLLIATAAVALMLGLAACVARKI